MDFNKLETFLIAASTLDLQATAKKIFRTQPAVTQQIKGLEKELGMILFEKKGKRLILTNQGQRLAETLRQPFEHLQESLGTIINQEAEPKGTIKIGILSDHAVSNDIFNSLADFSLKYTKLNTQVKFGTSREIEPLLLNNQLDFGILVYLANPNLFVCHPLAPATHYPVSSPLYLKSQGSITTVDQLLQADLLDLDPTWWTWTDWFECHFPKSVASLHHQTPRISIPSYKVLKQMVMKGLGVAMIPEYLIQEEIQNKLLQRLWPRKKSLTFNLSIVYRKTKLLRNYEEVFIQEMLYRIQKTKDM